MIESQLARNLAAQLREDPPERADPHTLNAVLRKLDAMSDAESVYRRISQDARAFVEDVNQEVPTLHLLRSRPEGNGSYRDETICKSNISYTSRNVVLPLRHALRLGEPCGTCTAEIRSQIGEQ